MHFRNGSGGTSTALGCGGLLALLGLVLISPVGEWLIKALGWVLLVAGIIVVLSSIYYWITSARG
jgi:hypothetical protein